MLSLCPHCQTLFRIHADQLMAMKGRVRCGVCMQPYQALDSLLETSEASSLHPVNNPQDLPLATEQAPNLFEEKVIDGDKQSSIEGVVSHSPSLEKPIEILNPVSQKKKSVGNSIFLNRDIIGVALLTLKLLILIILLSSRHHISKPSLKMELVESSINKIPHWPNLAQVSFTLNNPTHQALSLPSMALIFADGRYQVLPSQTWSEAVAIPSQTSSVQVLWINRAEGNAMNTTPSSWMPVKLQAID